MKSGGRPAAWCVFGGRPTRWVELTQLLTTYCGCCCCCCCYYYYYYYYCLVYHARPVDAVG